MSPRNSRGVHGRRLRVATKYMNLTRRFFAAARRRRLPHRRERRRDRGHACRRHRRADRRHHHDRHDAPRQSFEGAGGRADPQVAGASLRLARRANGAPAWQAPRRDRASCNLALTASSMAVGESRRPTLIAMIRLAHRRAAPHGLPRHKPRRAFAHHHPASWREGQCLEAVRGRRRAGRCARRHLSRRKATKSLFANGEEPAFFFAITLHTLELAAPAVATWSKPIMLYSVVPDEADDETCSQGAEPPHAGGRGQHHAEPGAATERPW